jgi:hypothetical protein
MRSRGRRPFFTGKLAEKDVKMLSQYGITRGAAVDAAVKAVRAALAVAGWPAAAGGGGFC